ncbi:MAG: class I SAM-dependent methyltransferase [Gammaproteobacteria bacterium]|nr:class I SAM-dependent methyltransferase [Gammaproteobacteria bacterium]
MIGAEIKDCRICQTSSVPYAHTPAAYDVPAAELLNCPQCGQVWKSRLLHAPREQVGEVATRGFSIQHASLVLEMLPQAVVRAPGIRVLDVGCWDGAVLADFPDTWIRHGIEPHPGAADRAIARGLTVFNTLVESAPLTADSYDVIVLLDVLEHLADPLAALNKLSAALTSGGYLVALTGNVASRAARFYKGCWYYCNYSEHVTFFCPDSVRQGLSIAGLGLVRLDLCRHHSATLGITVNRMARRLRTPPARGEDALPLPISKFDLLKLAASRILRGRDHLLFLAQKPGHLLRP